MRQLTKGDLARSLHSAGRTIPEIANTLHTTQDHIQNVLNVTPDYEDAAVSQNKYAKAFSGVLRFRDVEAARVSVQKIDALFHEYQAQGDRRGQHQSQLMALIGKNRAEGIGKREEAKLFCDWLKEHLEATE